MRHALRKAAFGLKVKQHIDHGFAAAAEIDGVLHAGGSSDSVFCDRSHQRIVAAAGVMEIGYGVGQPSPGQVSQVILKLTKRTRRFGSQMRVIDMIMRRGALHVDIPAPVVANGILMGNSAIPARDQREYPAVWFRSARSAQLVSDVRGDPSNIIHH